MRTNALQLWGAGAMTFILAGAAPGFLLRLLVRIYPKDHPRRRELIAELYTVPYKEQLLFVAQQLELAVTEGVPARWRRRRSARKAGEGTDIVHETATSLAVEDHERRALVLPPANPIFEGYRGPQVCEIVGLTYRQLDYWARTNLIRPSVADARETGSQRRYSYRDLVELKIIKSLLDAGVSLQSARRAIEYLRDNLGDGTASTKLVLNGAESALVRSDGELVNLMKRGQGIFSVVAIDGVKEELDSAITELRRPDDAAN